MDRRVRRRHIRGGDARRERRGRRQVRRRCALRLPRPPARARRGRRHAGAARVAGADRSKRGGWRTPPLDPHRPRARLPLAPDGHRRARPVPASRRGPVGEPGRDPRRRAAHPAGARPRDRVEGRTPARGRVERSAGAPARARRRAQHVGARRQRHRDPGRGLLRAGASLRGRSVRDRIDRAPRAPRATPRCRAPARHAHRRRAGTA